ncbi:MAG: BirA family transcriptional regulator [Mycobacterium sp.]|nr:BirA family transcriptional regulator [Mycobacterium sp.]
MSELRPLDADALRVGLPPPWRRLDVVAETGSTNADLLSRAADGEDVDGAVLIAEHQTAGRGRHGRTWTATPRTQITMSVGIAAGDVPTDAWGWLTLATGVAVVDAVMAQTHVAAALKWPNDVLAGGGKLAGILSEVYPPSLIVVGVGLNIALRDDDLPDPAATSLTQLGVASPDRERLIGSLLHELGDRVSSWRAAGGADDGLMRDYADHSLTIGSQVRVLLPGGRELTGLARSVDERGRLMVDEVDGDTVAVSAGDVVHLRPN